MNLKKKELIEKLAIYNYSFSESEKTVSIKLNFGLYVDVIFHEDNRIEIKDVFRKWNYLSGYIGMSISGQLIYTSISMVLYTVVSCLFMYIKPNLIPFLSIFYAMTMLLVIIWFFYNLISFDSMKRLVIIWTNLNVV